MTCQRQIWEGATDSRPPKGRFLDGTDGDFLGFLRGFLRGYLTKKFIGMFLKLVDLAPESGNFGLLNNIKHDKTPPTWDAKKNREAFF